MAVDPRDKRREGSRRAQAARAKREQAKQKNRNRNLLFGGGGLLAIIAVVASLALFSGGGEDPGRVVSTQDPDHHPVGSLADFQYSSNPPSSGPHYNHWIRPWGFQGTPLVVGEVVHNMEHGGVVIWYQPDDATLAGQVNALVRDMGSTCIIAGSYADMEWEVAATAWGRILELESYDREALVDFINAYRERLGPEAGLCQSNP
ncbi:MAG: DUF3105 domain-containing protein [Dehalococcoidia bacterium]